MKVIIVGLHYFSNLLAADLQQKYPEHTFISLDTYYNNKDKFRYLYHILSADILHSINGTVEKSTVIDIAIRLNKKVIMHWVGTDYVNSKKLFDQNKHKQNYLDYSKHVTVAPWYVNDLKNLGLQAEYLALKAFEKEYPQIDFQERFEVLCYISQDKAEFYGIKSLIEIAKQTPDVIYNLVGIASYKSPLPKNMKMHGWVEITDWIKKSVVCLRLPKTDGMSFFVLESLALHRYVGHNKDFKYSDYCVTVEDFVSYIKNKKALFDAGKLELNTKIAKEIVKEFEKDKVLTATMEVYQKLLNS